MSRAALIVHEERRQQNWPTVTVLSGPVSVGLSCWQEWCQGADRPSVAVEETDPAQWLHRYAEVVLDQCAPITCAEAYLAERIGTSHGNLLAGRKSLPELRLMFDAAALGDDRADRLCRYLLEADVTGESISAETVAEWFSDATAADQRLARLVAAMVALLRPGRSPALLVVPSAQRERSEDRFSHAPGGTVADIDAVATTLVMLTAHVPSATVGLCVEAKDFNDYLDHAPESHAKAALREACLVLQGLSVTEISEIVERRFGHSAPEYRRQIEQLAARGASPFMVDRFLDALVESTHQRATEATATSQSSEALFPSISTQTSEADLSPATFDHPAAISKKNVARSAAELYLYTVLESTPGLTGLFALNVRPGLDFGGRPMEVDLACLAKRIAVEIDGYYHFTDPVAYRRDRRKDFLLQQHGFLVLRFLAEDVVSELEAICERIRSALRGRHSMPTDHPKGTS